MRNKILTINDYVQDNLYLCMPDMRVNDQPFNSTLLFEILTYLVNGNQLLMGEYGLGKTTSAEHVVGLMDAMPRNAVLSAEIKGHPEQTEEKMIARPDLGQLNAGIEEVIWSHFVLSPSKIIDEVNRLPASKQNIILDGIETGNWRYMSFMVQNGAFPLYATSNYEDSGNAPLVEAVVDRFDVATESKVPGLMQFVSIKDVKKGPIPDNGCAEEVFKIWNDKSLSYEAKRKAVATVQSEYRAHVKDQVGLELLTETELANSRQQIDQMQFDNNAELFYAFASSEFIYCQTAGMKRANEPCSRGCHFSQYACGQAENGLSVRTALALANYSKALAWLNGKDKVTVEEVEKVLPYAIWHKLKFNDAFLGQYKDVQRFDPVRLHAAKELVKDIKGRFNTNMDKLSNYVVLMRDGRVDEANESIAELEHSVFRMFPRVTWYQ